MVSNMYQLILHLTGCFLLLFPPANGCYVGKWLGLAPIPHDRTMERLESRLSDKSGFLRFMRKTLTWLPEERATAKELLQDPWLRS